jgi:hydrogenase small subunit
MTGHISTLPVFGVVPVAARARPEPRLPWSSGDEPERSNATSVEHRDATSPAAPVHAFWLAGMSCDGCTIAVTGATAPGIEDLLGGRLPGVPRLVLHHPVLSVEVGEALMRDFELAAAGELGAPYVVVYEGSVPDERIAEALGGSWSVVGTEQVGGRPRAIPTAEWLQRLAPGAAAVIAIGSCAAQGGMPALPGNCTGAMSVADFLGRAYRGAAGLPAISLSGCPPVGDSFTQLVAALLRFLNGEPLPSHLEKLTRAA